MRALLCSEYGPPEKLAVQDIPSPVPGAGQVLIDVKAASLNFPDALMVQGLYQVKPPLPFSPGAEFAGLVSAVGAGVTRYKPGDRVIGFTGHGGLAEQCLADEGRVMPLPATMDFDQGAAFVLTQATSLHALKDCGHVQPGESLLVLGAAGGVGATAVEIGKLMGARVIAAASSEDKLALCRELGADETINYTTEDLRARVMELTGKRGVDVVYDPVGGAYAESALRATAWRGRFLIIGFASGEIPRIPLNLALLKERSLVGVYWGDSTRYEPKEHLANMQQLTAWFEAGKLKPAITERVGLGEAPAALRRMMDRKVKGKVVVRPQE